MSKKPETSLNLVKRFLTANGTWEKKNLLTAIYWVKLVASILTGLALGVFGITGYTGNLLFLGVSCLGIGLYVSNILNVDVETMFGSPYGAMTPNLMHTYAAFVLTWSFFYTLLHSSK